MSEAAVTCVLCNENDCALEDVNKLGKKGAETINHIMEHQGSTSFVTIGQYVHKECRRNLLISFDTITNQATSSKKRSFLRSESNTYDYEKNTYYAELVTDITERNQRMYYRKSNPRSLKLIFDFTVLSDQMSGSSLSSKD